MLTADRSATNQLDADSVLTHYWWVPGLLGASSIVIGLLLLVWPDRTFEVLAILLGIYLLIVGMSSIVLAAVEASGSRTVRLLLGAIAGIAGLVVIRHPGGSITLVALATGIALLLSGALRFVAALEAVEGKGWLMLGAVLEAGVGLTMVVWPQFGVTSLAILLGIALLVQGVLEVATAFALRGVGHTDRSQPDLFAG